MPFTQTVIAITLVGSILSGIAAALFIYDWIRKRAKATKEGGMSPILRWPKIVLGMVVFSVLCSAVGLWMLFHLPKPASCPVCPAVKECPALPFPPKAATQPRPLPDAGGRQVAHAGIGSTITQQQTAPGGVSVGRNVDQSGDGCQVKQVGNNNSGSVQCASQPLTISDPQISIAISELKKLGISDGDVSIMFEGTADGADEASIELQKILAGVGISAPINSAMRSYTIPGLPSYSGLSFGYACSGNATLANAIEKSLLQAKIIAKSMKPSKRGYICPAGAELELIIRKP